jgi:hypothetical protein
MNRPEDQASANKWQYLISLPRHLSKVARLTLQLALLAIFFWFFGLPAIEKYQEKRVMVVESWRHTAATIFAENYDSNGTNHGSYKNASFFEQVCGNLKGNESLENCIEENSNGKSDSLVDVLLGLKKQHSLTTEQHLKEEFAMPSSGRYYSLDLVPLKLSPDDEEHQLLLLLSYHYTYSILIHDPKFFFGFYNPSFPMVRESAVNPNSTSNYYHYLIVTEMNELDLPEDPCNPDPGYNFQTCLKQSLSRQVGCRTRWDRWSRLNLPLCTNMEQFR